MVIGTEAYEDGRYVARLRRWRDGSGVGAYTLFSISLLTFLAFVANNLNALRP